LRTLISQEENMLKPVIAATAVFAIAGSSIVYAQQRWNGPEGDGGPRYEHRHHLSAEDRAALTDARIAALKAGLELTADQAKSWPAFEQALRDMAQLRAQRRQAREAASQQPQTPGSPFDRLSQRADNMSKFGAALKRVADTGAPLYMSLNDAQKDRFKMLSRILRPHHHMHASGDGRGFGRGGHRFGGDGDGWGGEHRFGGEGGWREGHGFGHEGHRFGHDRARIHELMGNENGDEQESQL
jgi:LTXXQ motif family protein